MLRRAFRTRGAPVLRELVDQRTAQHDGVAMHLFEE